ncbi:Uncharacterised protein [Mycobacteroides abscessus subsp. abscessus]|nr:Uncharacterised protein [Mycobacteroides abscessus subsp. abscessus]
MVAAADVASMVDAAETVMVSRSVSMTIAVAADSAGAIVIAMTAVVVAVTVASRSARTSTKKNNPAFEV